MAEQSDTANSENLVDENEQADMRPPRDHEAASIALSEVQQWLQRFELIKDVGASEGSDDRAEIVERVNKQQLLSHLQVRLKRMHPADVGHILEALPSEDREQLWGLIGADRDAVVLLEVSDSVREFLISITPASEMAEMASTMDADHLAELAEWLPDDIVELVQRQLTEKERQQLRAALSSEEDTVGAHMDFDFVTVREDVTIETVFRYLRRFDRLPPHTDAVFVVDRDEVLKGVLPTDRLLISEPETPVADVMMSDYLTFDAPDNIYEGAQAFERYDLGSAPVVGPAGRLIGRLVISEVVDVIREDVETDMLNQAGLFEEEDIFASVWKSARNRWLWLALNLCTAFFASRVIGLFEGTIEKIVALAALMPIVAGIAGNSGNQTMALVIRALALGRLNASNIGRLLGKEVSVALMNGVLWGGIAGAFAWWLYSDTPHGQTLGITMMLAMMLNLLLAALVAILVPMFLQRIGRDPAMGSPVLLTFSTDSMGFMIFLGLATILFR